MQPLVKPVFPDMLKVSAHFQKSLDSGQISNFGHCFNEACKRLDDINGRFNLLCATGTAAIQLAVQATFKRGDRILMPDFTHVGTLQAVLAAGCEPVLVPVSRATWVLNESFIHCVPDDQYEGFIVVSPFGYRVNFESFDILSEAIDKPVIYDLAGAWGMAVDTLNPVCFSLHGTKNFSCGEGGIVSFTSAIAAQETKRMMNFGTLPDRTVETPYANNLKPDELKCAVVLAHLDDHEAVISRITRKRMLIDYYQMALGEVCIQHNLHHGNAAPSLCVLAGLPAEHIEQQAIECGFVAKLYYPLLTHMAGLETVKRFGASSPYFRTCLALPSDVDDEGAEFVVKRLKGLLRVLGATTSQR